MDNWSAEELLPHLAGALEYYVGRYPAFRSKPIGQEGSQAREQQMRDIASEELSKVLIERAKQAVHEEK